MRRALSGAAALLLAACAQTPDGGATSSGTQDESPRLIHPVSARDAAPESGFEERLKARALSQGRQGRLAEAAVSWEILTVLRPGVAFYREHLRETRRLIDAAVGDAMQRGQQAQRRGDIETASAQYLAALAFKPDHAAAAEALRAIERERARRPAGAGSRMPRVRASSPSP